MLGSLYIVVGGEIAYLRGPIHPEPGGEITHLRGPIHPEPGGEIAHLRGPIHPEPFRKHKKTTKAYFSGIFSIFFQVDHRTIKMTAG